jgi:hypothetical protein
MPADFLSLLKSAQEHDKYCEILKQHMLIKRECKCEQLEVDKLCCMGKVPIGSSPRPSVPDGRTNR